MGPPDTGLFRAINHWPQSLGPVMRFFGEATNYPWVKAVLGIFLVGMLWATPLTRKTVIQALIAVALANTLTNVFKDIWPMHRPFQDFPADTIMWVGKTDHFGTASAHSANMAAVALVFVYHLRWWGTPWVVIAILVGISRIYCGAHYPYQVALGAMCGLVSAYGVAKGWDLYQKRRTPVAPEV